MTSFTPTRPLHEGAEHLGGTKHSNEEFGWGGLADAAPQGAGSTKDFQTEDPQMMGGTVKWNDQSEVGGPRSAALYPVATIDLGFEEGRTSKRSGGMLTMSLPSVFALANSIDHVVFNREGGHLA